MPESDEYVAYKLQEEQRSQQMDALKKQFALKRIESQKRTGWKQKGGGTTADGKPRKGQASRSASATVGGPNAKPGASRGRGGAAAGAGAGPGPGRGGQQAKRGGKGGGKQRGRL
eukprot:TRINITY_DN5013_c0_g1_i2.p3 TRINITY_DN5013_c0_g1~~TRINITY_DN5013_c0_g1_i2.p3  ORF type:complete len:115 (+),score=22.67 TRINITY_DN5013_c0_g1_i2:1125-1469(+)